MTFSLSNPTTPTYPSTRFPAQAWPSAQFCGGVLPLLPTDGVGFETNGEQHPLASDVTAAADSITFADDISGIPTSGWLYIDQERIFYTQADYGTRTVSGLLRGGDAPPADLTTVPAAHMAGCVAFFGHMAINHNFLVQELNAFESLFNGFATATCAHDASQDAALVAMQSQLSSFNTRLTTDESDISTLKTWRSTVADPFFANGALFTAQDGSGGSEIVNVGETVRLTGTGTITVTRTGPAAGPHVFTINGTSGPAPSPSNWASFPATSAVDMACNPIDNIGFAAFCDRTANDPAYPTGNERVRLYEKDYGSVKRLFMRTSTNEERRIATDADLTGGSGGGDNLGNHIATQDLNMDSHDIVNGRSFIAPTANSFITLAPSPSSSTRYVTPSTHEFIDTSTQVAVLDAAQIDLQVPTAANAGFKNSMGVIHCATGGGGTLTSGVPTQTFTIPLPITMPNTGYIVVPEVTSAQGQVIAYVVSKTTTSFVVRAGFVERPGGSSTSTSYDLHCYVLYSVF